MSDEEVNRLARELGHLARDLAVMQTDILYIKERMAGREKWSQVAIGAVITTLVAAVVAWLVGGGLAQ